MAIGTHAKEAAPRHTWNVPEAPGQIRPTSACRTFQGTQAAFEEKEEGSTPLRH